MNPNKCILGVSSLQFLGHHVSEKGLQPSQSNVAAIVEYERPRTRKQLLTFLGMVQFYSRFVERLAELLNPPYVLTRTGHSRFTWTMEAEDSFVEVKRRLANATILAHPSDSADIELVTDASEVAMGAVLNQVTGEVRRPLAFWSKTLKPLKQKWSCCERELYACFSAIRHFRYFLESRDFVLRTDHKPIVTKFHCDSLAASPRKARFIDYIVQFTDRVEHVSGNANVADALSRPNGSPQINSILPQVAAIDYLELAMQQRFDPEIVEMRNSNTSSLVLKEVPLAESGVHILCDDSMRKLRPVIPASMRFHVFCYFHNLAHPEIRGSVRLLTVEVVWNGIRKDVATWARQCLECCRSKVQRHTLALFQEISYPPTSCFTHVYVDLTGPLPPSNGYTCLMVAVCRFSRYFQAIPMKGITAEECASSFVSGWVSLVGSPSHVYCDRGSQFK